MHAIWGNWAPLWERSKLAGFCYAGKVLHMKLVFHKSNSNVEKESKILCYFINGQLSLRAFEGGQNI